MKQRLPLQPIIRITFAAALLASFFQPSATETDSSRSEFFINLEEVLRTDYRLCTGRSANRPMDELLAWRRSVDSITATPDYPVIVRKFTEETGIHPTDVRPCEIIGWMEKKEQEIEETTRFLSEEVKSAEKKRRDSIFLANEINIVSKAGYDFAGIPFGISERAFTMLSVQKKLGPIVKEGPHFRCDSVEIGVMTFKAAFHFNRDGRYWCYELESGSCSVDSIDLWARGNMEYLAAHMETGVSTPPDHIYRIGHFDIVPGRLAIGRLWNFNDAAVYIGLARSQNRYYAKAIVRSK